jgi:hypothetical protein
MNTMRTIGLIRHTVIAALLTLMAWLPALPTQATDQLSGEGVPSAFDSMGENGNVAMGAVEDTLRACVARIPKEASIGQRMIAESSCQRDEMDRKIIQDVPDTEYASR